MGLVKETRGGEGINPPGRNYFFLYREDAECSETENMFFCSTFCEIYSFGLFCERIHVVYSIQ